MYFVNSTGQTNKITNNVQVWKENVSLGCLDHILFKTRLFVLFSGFLQGTLLRWPGSACRPWSGPLDDSSPSFALVLKPVREPQHGMPRGIKEGESKEAVRQTLALGRERAPALPTPTLLSELCTAENWRAPGDDDRERLCKGLSGLTCIILPFQRQGTLTFGNMRAVGKHIQP